MENRLIYSVSRKSEASRPLNRSRRERIILNWILKGVGLGTFYLTGSRQHPYSGSCQYDTESSAFMKGGRCLVTWSSVSENGRCWLELVLLWIFGMILEQRLCCTKQYKKPGAIIHIHSEIRTHGSSARSRPKLCALTTWPRKSSTERAVVMRLLVYHTGWAWSLGRTRQGFAKLNLWSRRTGWAKKSLAVTKEKAARTHAHTNNSFTWQKNVLPV